MRGSKWVEALREAQELPEFLREKWEVIHGDDPFEVGKNQSIRIFGALMLLILGLLFLGASWGAFCYTAGEKINRSAAEFTFFVSLFFLFMSVLLLVLSLRENSADEFFKQLKAARDIWQTGFQEMAKWDKARLKEMATQALKLQAKKLLDVQEQLATSQSNATRIGWMAEETKVREEFRRQHQVFLALGLAEEKWDSYFDQTPNEHPITEDVHD